MFLCQWFQEPLTENKELIMPINIKSFIFNPFQENTYIIYDETKECVIVDAGCQTQDEQNILSEFIESTVLKPVKLLNTHCHIDHIMGNGFIYKEFGLRTQAHKDEIQNLENAPEHAELFDVKFSVAPSISIELNEGDKVKFGNSVLDILHLPGHSAGSLAFYNKQRKFVLVGDVLFKDGIGRTDLPGGNYETLIFSIKEKLFSLGEEFVVYPGHGPESTIGEEKRSNPFLV